MGDLISGKAGLPDDIAAIIGALSEVHRATQISEIGHDAVVPEEWILGGNSGAGIRCEASVGGPHDDAGTLVIAAPPWE